MNTQTILRFVTYVTAGFILVVGIFVLSGYSILGQVQTNFRTILGIMMILYGIYRIIMITVKKRTQYDKE